MPLNIKRPQVRACHMENDTQCIAQVGSDLDLGGYIFVAFSGVSDGEVKWSWRVFDSEMIQITASDHSDNNNEMGTPFGLHKSPVEALGILCEFFAATDEEAVDADQKDTALYGWISWNREELDTLSRDIAERYQLLEE